MVKNLDLEKLPYPSFVVKITSHDGCEEKCHLVVTDYTTYSEYYLTMDLDTGFAGRKISYSKDMLLHNFVESMKSEFYEKYGNDMEASMEITLYKDHKISKYVFDNKENNNE